MTDSNYQFILEILKPDGLTSKEARQLVKRSFSLTQETMEAIRKIAQDNGMTDNEVLSILVQRGLLVETVLLAGGQVIAKDKNGQELILADSNIEVVPRRLNNYHQGD